MQDNNLGKQTNDPLGKAVQQPSVDPVAPEIPASQAPSIAPVDQTGQVGQAGQAVNQGQPSKQAWLTSQTGQVAQGNLNTPMINANGEIVKPVEDPKISPVGVRISSEAGPINLEIKPIDQEVQKDQNVEKGQEFLESSEKEKQPETAERKEGVSAGKITDQSAVSKPLPKQLDVVDEKIKKAKDLKVSEQPSIHVDGFPIDESLIKDTDRIQREKGKGDTGDALTSIFILLDKILRKQNKSK